MGDGDNPEFARYDGRDEWDEWNDRRNADMNAYGGRKIFAGYRLYRSLTICIGTAAGCNVESYGLAWVPYSVGVSWAPYSVGRWCYRPFYGWTWVSYEPWGWLPYHYGRWYRSSIYGWCWLPGPSFAFNFWSPALVTFYSGPGWISWCPLGPGDYYNVNRYHYNRGIYGHQLAQLRGLHTRAPGDPFHRGHRDAFRTVDIDRFRNGSFGDRRPGSRAARISISPGSRANWSGTVCRSSRLRQASDRLRIVSANGPERARRGRCRQWCATVPDRNLRGQEQFRRITNPADSRASIQGREANDRNRREEPRAGDRIQTRIRGHRRRREESAPIRCVQNLSRK